MWRHHQLWSHPRGFDFIEKSVKLRHALPPMLEFRRGSDVVRLLPHLLALRKDLQPRVTDESRSLSKWWDLPKNKRLQGDDLNGKSLHKQEVYLIDLPAPRLDHPLQLLYQIRVPCRQHVIARCDVGVQVVADVDFFKLKFSWNGVRIKTASIHHDGISN